MKAIGIFGDATCGPEEADHLAAEVPLSATARPSGT
jgi:hypothetical protein